ncbi:MAG: TrkA family potassium uptake protein [Chloroflexi bacterium]|nr:TrkA family potassium uptake protein [Chloroflexota bacterium]MCH8309190.1 TrkA family potassium uptake protein [Chloroflexota bacterium]
MYSRFPGSGFGPRHAVIVGCGRTGADIAVALSEAGYVVLILDTVIASFDILPSGMVEDGDIQPILGDGTLESDLRRAFAQDASVFIAVSGNDAANALSAQIAHHMLHIPKVICRLNDPVMKEMYEGLELTTVSPTGLVRDLIVDATNG